MLDKKDKFALVLGGGVIAKNLINGDKNGERPIIRF